MSDQLTELRKSLENTNALLRSLGLPTIEAVNPSDCLPAPVNARYMTPEMMANLTANIIKDKRLESLPLCAADKKAGKFRIISGHHRITAAKNAKLEFILILVIEVADPDEMIKKQLSHNSLTGRDNEVILKELYDALGTLDDKYYAGLADTLESISPVSLNFRAGLSCEMSMIFMGEDIELTGQVLDQLAKEIKASGPLPVVHIAAKSCYDEYATALKRIKKLENIKNNASAFLFMVKLAQERLEQIQAERQPGPPPQ